jgi:hypothetical protein
VTRRAAQDLTAALRVRAVAPWLALTAVLCAGTLLVDRVSAFYSELVVVTLGPLLPAAGLGLSYTAPLDADYELVVASPYPTLRLLLLRAALYLAAAAGALLLCGLGLGRPGLGARVLVCAVAALTAGLAASTFLAPPLATAVVAAGWLAVVTLVLGVGDVQDPTDTAGLVLAAAVAALAVAVLSARRQVLSTDWRYS